MRAADLPRAASLAADLAMTREMLARVSAGDALRLFLGEAGKQAEIVLSAAYLEQLRADIAGAFAAREAEIAAELARLGVEP